jgi:hypothetical protein
MGAVPVKQKLNLKQCRPRHVWQHSADPGIPFPRKSNSEDVPIDTLAAKRTVGLRKPPYNFLARSSTRGVQNGGFLSRISIQRMKSSAG